MKCPLQLHLIAVDKFSQLNTRKSSKMIGKVICLLAQVADKSPYVHNLLMDIIDHTEHGFCWRKTKRSTIIISGKRKS